LSASRKSDTIARKIEEDPMHTRTGTADVVTLEPNRATGMGGASSPDTDHREGSRESARPSTDERSSPDPLRATDRYRLVTPWSLRL
jgi:hypothetical protein